MIFKKPYEEQLLRNGYESLPYEFKNMIVLDLANNFGIPFNEVTMDMILQVHKTLKLAETEEYIRWKSRQDLFIQKHFECIISR